MAGCQSHVDMHGIKWAHDPATVGTLENAQPGQHLYIIMNAPDIARRASSLTDMGPLP